MCEDISKKKKGKEKEMHQKYNNYNERQKQLKKGHFMLQRKSDKVYTLSSHPFKRLKKALTVWHLIKTQTNRTSSV